MVNSSFKSSHISWKVNGNNIEQTHTISFCLNIVIWNDKHWRKQLFELWALKAETRPTKPIDDIRRNKTSKRKKPWKSIIKSNQKVKEGTGYF